MACTRFNYDKCRTLKYLQQSSDPGRYYLNTPGNGDNPAFVEEPHLRMQGWGGNLREVPGGHPIDIDSELIGLNRKPTKHGCKNYDFNLQTEERTYKSTSFNIDETRASHPAWQYRELSHARWEYPLINPQNNTEIPFSHNDNSSLLYKDNFKTQIPIPLNK
jgi:hypothetical protein